MRSRSHYFLACLLVAVLACGNGLSFAAEWAEHSGADFSDVLKDGGAHHHVQTHGHEHIVAKHVAGLAGSTSCGALDCPADDHPGARFCHIHAHCCTSGGYVPADVSSFPDPTILRAAFMSAAASISPGAMTFPLLRPPRFVA